MARSAGVERVGPPSPGDSWARGRLLATVDEAARKLSISRRSCYRLLERGELASIRVGSRRRIPVSSLHAYIAERLVAEELAG